MACWNCGERYHENNLCYGDGVTAHHRDDLAIDIDLVPSDSGTIETDAIDAMAELWEVTT